MYAALPRRWSKAPSSLGNFSLRSPPEPAARGVDSVRSASLPNHFSTAAERPAGPSRRDESPGVGDSIFRAISEGGISERAVETLLEIARLLSAPGGRDADDAVKGGLRDIKGALVVEHDAAGVAQVPRHDGDLPGWRDPEDLTDVEPAADEHAAIASHRQVGPVVVSSGQSRDEMQPAISAELEHLSDGAEQDEIVARCRRDADEPPQWLLTGRDRPILREERGEQIGPSG